MADKDEKSEEVPQVAKPAVNMAQQQEALLKKKYGNLPKKKGSNLLQNRMTNRGPKQYFDSGDYNMARAKMQKNKSSCGESPEEEGGAGDQLKVPPSGGINSLIKNKVPGLGENPSMSRLRKSSQSNLVFPAKK